MNWHSCKVLWESFYSWSYIFSDKWSRWPFSNIKEIPKITTRTKLIATISIQIKLLHRFWSSHSSWDTLKERTKLAISHKRLYYSNNLTDTHNKIALGMNTDIICYPQDRKGSPENKLQQVIQLLTHNAAFPSLVRLSIRRKSSRLTYRQYIRWNLCSFLHDNE